MQTILFNDAIDMFNKGFIKEKIYFISNELVKQVNANFLTILDTLKLMLSINSLVKKATISIDLSNAMYNFIQFKNINHHLETSDLISKLIYIIENFFKTILRY